MNPLDWQGPEFLSLYVPLLVGGFLAALLLRYHLRQPAGEPLPLGRRPDPYEVAALDGPNTLIEAAVAALFHRKALRVENLKLVTGEELPADAAPIERAVFQRVAAGSTSTHELRQALSADIERYRQRLSQKGLVLDEYRAAPVQIVPTVAYGAVLLLGLLKIFVGLSRDRPVLFLVLLTGLAALGFLVLGKVPWRTRLGDATLKSLREEHQALRTTTTAGGTSEVLNGQELALAVGLFGPAMLIPMGYGDLRQTLRPFSSGDAGGGGSSSGDSSCGGGGCGGCGGGGD
jgi:uncharacterized protein (TIGR04222 family)